MDATCLLVLVVVGVACATVPEPYQGVPAAPCQDVPAASGCQEDQLSPDLWASLAMDGTQGDVAVPGGKKKCSLCTKILKRMKALAGDDPDQEAVTAALDKGCRMLGKLLHRFCKWLGKKMREKISQVLQDGDKPHAACVTLGFCKA